MENKTIKEEIVNEVDDFEKALLDRDKEIWTKEEVDAVKHSLTNSPQALRYNSGKLEWSLVDFDSLEGLVRVLEYGKDKYARHNWKKGMPVTQVTESLMRHLFAYLGGEDVDPESGCRHISHVMCNAMFIEYIMREKPHYDDRETASEL